MATYKSGNHKLRSDEESRQAIVDATSNDPVTIARLGSKLQFLDGQDRLLGTLTNRHEVAKRLDTGETLLSCFVAWTYAPSDRHPNGLASVCVVTGAPEEPHNQWMLREVWGKTKPDRSASPPKTYPVGLAAERFFQPAIRSCQIGEEIMLWREIGNPHDDHAVVATTRPGKRIGYLPRSSWLQAVIHRDGLGARATIAAVRRGDVWNVVIGVTVSTDELSTLAYQAHSDG